MPGAAAERFDFFLSRRGSVAATAQEVAAASGEQTALVTFTHDDYRTAAILDGSTPSAVGTTTASRKERSLVP